MPFTQSISPVLFSLGPFEVRFYGLVYALALLAALFWFKHNEKKLNINAEELILYVFTFLIIGARLGHVIIYNLPYYLHNIKEIFFIWHGGLSFFGGLLGSLFGLWLYAKKDKKTKEEILRLLDYGAVLAPFFLFLGRIANFINSELYGKITNLPWCVYFPTTTGCRHPAQLYEAFYSIIIFAVLIYLFGLYYKLKHTQKQHSKKESKIITSMHFKEGTIFYSFLTMYGLFRFITSFFRDEPAIFMNLTLNHFLCLALFFIGLFLLIKNLRSTQIEKRK